MGLEEKLGETALDLVKNEMFRIRWRIYLGCFFRMRV